MDSKKIRAFNQLHMIAINTTGASPQKKNNNNKKKPVKMAKTQNFSANLHYVNRAN